ncbi:MAG: Tll0287-like domain-containing protein, partial [Thermodesulfobacteriota bacterium]
MIRKGFVLGILSILVVVFVYLGTSSGAKECGGIPAEKVADMVHAVIESNRTFYTVHVVNRMQAKGVVVASENWRDENTLPL